MTDLCKMEVKVAFGPDLFIKALQGAKIRYDVTSNILSVRNNYVQ